MSEQQPLKLYQNYQHLRRQSLRKTFTNSLMPSPVLKKSFPKLKRGQGCDKNVAKEMNRMDCFVAEDLVAS